MKIVVLPGDGISPEIASATMAVLEADSLRFPLGLDFVPDIDGHESLRRNGATVTPTLLEKVRQADGLILGPMAKYDFKDDSKGEINLSKFFHKAPDLYANVRPVRTYPGLPSKVGTFDLVVVRENTEGFYADRNIESVSSKMIITPDMVISLRRITRHSCKRVARAACELAMTRRRRLTIVHKANVLKLGDGMFIDICHEVASHYPDLVVDDCIVDAMMAHVVCNPDQFDVIVTTNMLGGTLSDLTAELSGSLGLGGSLNASDLHAVDQAAHGAAPDIAGRDLANPFALILSASQLLSSHGKRRDLEAFLKAAALIDSAVVDAISQGQATSDIGGKFGPAASGQALAR